jgi:hypothetical protein
MCLGMEVLTADTKSHSFLVSAKTFVQTVESFGSLRGSQKSPGLDWRLNRGILKVNSSGLVVKAEDSRSGFKPRCRLLDGVCKASYYNGKK